MRHVHTAKFPFVFLFCATSYKTGSDVTSAKAALMTPTDHKSHLAAVMLTLVFLDAFLLHVFPIATTQRLVACSVGRLGDDMLPSLRSAVETL